jgi:hypothetical protein
MREPWATMFAGYESHWMLGEHLRGDEPDWHGIAADPRLDCLSRGETVLIDFAAALRNVQLHLDGAHQIRVMLALQHVCGV